MREPDDPEPDWPILRATLYAAVVLAMVASAWARARRGRPSGASPAEDQDSGDTATLAAALDRELSGPAADHEAGLFGEGR